MLLIHRVFAALLLSSPALAVAQTLSPAERRIVASVDAGQAGVRGADIRPARHSKCVGGRAQHFGALGGTLGLHHRRAQRERDGDNERGGKAGSHGLSDVPS